MSSIKLSLDHYAGLLQLSAERLRLRGQLPWLGDVPMTGPVALDLVYSLFVRVVEDEMAWVRGDGRAWWVAFHEHCRKHYPAWGDEGAVVSRRGQSWETGAEPTQTVADEATIEILDLVYTDVLDPLYLAICELVTTQLGISSTWDIYHIRRRDVEGCNGIVDVTVLLENAGDYRIADWKRRMASGEWRRERPIETSAESTVAHGEQSSYDAANRESLRQVSKTGVVGTVTRLGLSANQKVG